MKMDDRKARILWHRFADTEAFSRLVEKYKRITNEIGIPVFGATIEEKRKWLIKTNRREKDMANKLLENFINEAGALKNYRDDFQFPLLVFFLDGDAFLGGINLTHCRIVKLDNDGALIKIGLNASRSDVELFLKNEWRGIQMHSNVVRQHLDAKREPRLRMPTKYARDISVIFFSKLNMKTLQQLSGCKSNYRDICIAKIINKNGLGPITSENVRRVMSQKKGLSVV